MSINNTPTKSILMILGQDFLRPKIDPRVNKEALSLIAAGYKVNLLSITKYPSSIENFHGINIVFINDQANLVTLRDRSIFLSLYGVFFGLIKNLKNVIDASKKIDFGIIHCHDADTLIFGLIIKFLRKKKVKLIYDSHEIATEMLSFKAFKPFIGLIEKIASHSVDGFITINDSAKKFILKKYPKFTENCQIIRNVPKVLVNLEPQKVTKPVKFLYQGNLKKDRQQVFFQILESLKTFDPKKWHLTLLVDQIDLDNLDLARFNNISVEKCIVDPLEFQKKLNHFDVGIIAMDNTCLNNYYSLPNKLFDYMTAAVAVLGPNYPEIAKVVKASQNGLLFSDQKSLHKNIDFLLENPTKINLYKKNSLKAVQNNYNWNVEEKKLVNFYRNTA